MSEVINKPKDAMQPPSTPDKEKFVGQWQTGLHIRHKAHSQCFSYYKTRDRIVGLSATILSALVSTAVIVSFTKSDDLVLKAIAGGCSVLATLFASANTFLKYGELAAKHELAAAAFGQIRRELELAECWDGGITKDFLEQIMNKWAELEKASPDIPQNIYDEAETSIEEKTIADAKAELKAKALLTQHEVK
jgi:hypothetical protein